MLNCGDPKLLSLDPCTPVDPKQYSGPTYLQAQAPKCIQETYGMLGGGQYPSNYTVGKNYGNGYGTMQPPGFNSPANQQCLQQYQAIQNQIEEGKRINAIAWQNKLNREANTARSQAEQDKRASIAAAETAKTNLTSLVQSAGSASGGLFDVVSCEVDAKPPICRVYLAAFSSVYSNNRNAIGAAAARLAGIAATSPPRPAGAQPSQPLTAVSAVASVAAIVNSRPPTTLKKPKGRAVIKPKRVSSASSN